MPTFSGVSSRDLHLSSNVIMLPTNIIESAGALDVLVGNSHTCRTQRATYREVSRIY